MTLPTFIAPQLAKLVDAAPEGDDWIHELKFDGYRILARLEQGRVSLLSRTGRDWTAQFPSVADAIARLDARTALLDGEVAVALPDGRTSFQALQNAGGGDDVTYFVFDLLYLDGEDVARRPLEDRKARLAELVTRSGVARIRYADHITGRGRDFFHTACKAGLEGIISKRRRLPYQPGRRGGWLKTKCTQRQEMVIGGFTDPEGSRVGIGALLVGVYEDGRFVYVGKVGTGYTRATAERLRMLLEPIEQPHSPFDPAPARAWTGPNVHWATPTFIAEVAFTEWTDDGRIRHPSFKGLRDDKAPEEVRRELPAPIGGSRRR